MKLTLTQWLDHLENRHAMEVQLRLANMQEMVERLALNNLNCPVITVTGTNGKGSTVRSLEAIYMAAGYRVGSYTSPHLYYFNERIKVNQKSISDEDLCALFDEINQQPGGNLLTYFEMATAAALAYFKQQNLDVVILEVGVGGRLDATNTIDADLAIITTVALDHQDYLGTTLEEIGFEKAGILKKGCRFVYGDVNPPQSVVNQAKIIQAESYYFGKDYFFDDDYQFTLQNKVYDLPHPKLHYKSAAAAIMATYALQDVLPILAEHWHKALETAEMQGRQQIIVENGVTYIFDVAHNPQAVGELAKRLSKAHQVHAIFSGLNDKDLVNNIAPMVKNVDIWYPILLTGKRAADKSMLENAFSQQNPVVIPRNYFDSPLAAFEAVQETIEQGDVVVVYGSFLVVSPILKNRLGELHEN